MIYTAWSDACGTEWSFAPGEALPAGDTPTLRPVKTFEADSWQDALRQYHEWQGWAEPGTRRAVREGGGE